MELILTIDDDPDIAAEAARRGASGYVIKSAAVSELFEAIETVLAGKRYVSPALSTPATWPAAPRQKHGLSALTSRQREVLQLLADGNSMKEAASAQRRAGPVRHQERPDPDLTPAHQVYHF